MSVADRITIIADGKMIERTPQEIYNKPKKQFTAEFLGENILIGKIDNLNKSKIVLDINNDKIEIATTIIIFQKIKK